METAEAVETEWDKVLRKIAGHLESLEDTIIPCLLQRAQFMQNKAVYEEGKSGFEGREHESLLDIRLRDYESSDARAGRYQVPHEVPFSKLLPKPERKAEAEEADWISGIALDKENRVDLSDGIFSAYMLLLKKVCEPGDDHQHGSCTDWDIPALRAIAERIHYGSMYVAECKFRGKPEKFTALIKARDRDGLKTAVTRPCKEKEIYERVRQKVIGFQKDANPEARRIIDPEIVVEFYRNVIIPLTKKGEVMYLMQKKI